MGCANFISRIGSTISFGSVILDTLIRLIMFHIILVNILFLLCLADIDNLGVFFNNITNHLIETHPS